jgi:hypothetical protein
MNVPIHVSDQAVVTAARAKGVQGRVPRIPAIATAATVATPANR